MAVSVNMVCAEPNRGGHTDTLLRAMEKLYTPQPPPSSTSFPNYSYADPSLKCLVSDLDFQLKRGLSFFRISNTPHPIVQFFDRYLFYNYFHFSYTCAFYLHQMCN